MGRQTVEALFFPDIITRLHPVFLGHPVVPLHLADRAGVLPEHALYGVDDRRLEAPGTKIHPVGRHRPQTVANFTHPARGTSQLFWLHRGGMVSGMLWGVNFKFQADPIKGGIWDLT